MSKPDPNDRGWGDNKLARFNYLVREVLVISEEMDNYDLNSADEKSCLQWRALRKEYVASALKLLEHVVDDPVTLRTQIEAMLRDH